MAKKQTKKVEVEEQPQVEQTMVMEQAPVQSYEKPGKDKIKTAKQPSWEVKDRTYFLVGNKQPMSRSIKSANIYYFDEDKGYERELKYTNNQRTCFVDEMVGDQRLEHIVFRNGSLNVPKNKVVLQQLLSLWHPHKGNLYNEFKPLEQAKSQLENIELELEALNAAVNLDIDMAEAVMRVELGSKVSEMSSKELKRDLLLYAKRNPALFLELVNDDNVQLRNFGIKATELNIIKLSSDQRHFMWGSNDRKLMTVPFDEHPYSALASWFKTDEGMEVYTNIEKRLS